MRFLDVSERLKILISLSDQLWDDYKCGNISEDDYFKRADEVREKINKVTDMTLLDLENLSSSIGYILIKKNNAFGTVNNFKIAKN
ncbi:hypothetical protein EGI16_03655 [Chryseobacterium sp. G0240]|uniref:hypothetical protein n=1 Tax=Chryseobacterium sp. G0240 TaxID=2487066 RepID=UPI000F45751D|nr:hypothetical protein [Chryseobacterium sp. G0240]ROI05493.1 hypothetical protein EGI16_03655 [Chryseobacterium sp. G0240]